MITKDGGPVFPLCGTVVKQYQPTGIVTGESLQGFQAGMSLRDYFAAKAMQGMLSNPEFEEISKDFSGEDALKYLTTVSWGIANSMLEAREK